MLQHNIGDCVGYCCYSEPGYGFEECINGGSSGYCSPSGFWEYCATTAPAGNCYQCVPTCAQCGAAK